MTTDAVVADAVDTEVGEQQKTTESAAPAALPAGEKDTALEVKTEEAKTEEVKTETETVYDFKVPEGMTLGPETDKFTALAKELKLQPEAAQRLVDLVVEREQTRAEAHAKQVATWGAELAADREIGGANEKETRALAAKALALAPLEVRTMLEASGLGNYPPLVRWARAIGKALSEDTHVPASRPAVSEQSRADRLYGKTQLRN